MKNYLKFGLEDLTLISATVSAVWSVMSSAVMSLGD